MRILFSGGGTAGHVNPAIAIAEALSKRNPESEIAFIGREGGKENELVKSAGIRLFTIPVSGLSRSLSPKNLKAIKNALSAKRIAKDILKEFTPDAVIGTGGYVCWPVLSAAHACGIPTAIHESNASFGLTTRLLANKCDLLLLGTDTCTEKHKNAVYTGNPLRADFGKSTKREARHLLKIPNGKRLIISVGGSIGAKKLNDACVAVMKDYSVKDRSILHIHSCGSRYYEQIQKLFPELCKGSGNCRIVPFIKNMATALTAADAVISRCGAMTLSEIAYCATPAILIPSPNVTGNHQLKNARYFCDLGAAVLLEESELDEENLWREINEILSHPEVAVAMSKKMREAAVTDAADKIADIICNRLLTK